MTGTLAVADPDSTNLAGGDGDDLGGYVAAQDFLDFTNQGGISGTFSNGTLTLTGTATLAAYQTALRSVQYRNSSENPSTAARTVSFRVTDPDGNQSNVTTRTVTITAVNDAPVAVDDAYATDEDAALTVPAATGVLDNDTDADGDGADGRPRRQRPARHPDAEPERVVHLHPDRELQRHRLVHLPGRATASLTSNPATVDHHRHAGERRPGRGRRRLRDRRGRPAHDRGAGRAGQRHRRRRERP